MTNQVQRNPWLATRTRTGSEYDAPYAARAAAGMDVHGEANFLMQLFAERLAGRAPESGLHVLDAGCGTGRIAIELARRGCRIVGVDLDEEMLKQARTKAPQFTWRQGDLSTIALEDQFDAIVLAGNVMIYLTPGTEAAVLTNLAQALVPGGLLVAAFELNIPSWSKLTLPLYDQLAATAGLAFVERWASWDRGPWLSSSRYAVSVHKKTG